MDESHNLKALAAWATTEVSTGSNLATLESIDLTQHRRATQPSRGDLQKRVVKRVLRRPQLVGRRPQLRARVLHDGNQ
jgi:hypothetical protein